MVATTMSSGEECGKPPTIGCSAPFSSKKKKKQPRGEGQRWSAHAGPSKHQINAWGNGIVVVQYALGHGVGAGLGPGPSLLKGQCSTLGIKGETQCSAKHTVQSSALWDHMQDKGRAPIEHWLGRAAMAQQKKGGGASTQLRGSIARGNKCLGAFDALLRGRPANLVKKHQRKSRLSRIFTATVQRKTSTMRGKQDYGPPGSTRANGPLCRRPSGMDLHDATCHRQRGSGTPHQVCIHLTGCLTPLVDGPHNQ